MPGHKSAIQPSLSLSLSPSLSLTLISPSLFSKSQAITLLGRLSQADHNPAHALPPLRKLLIQLLAELQQFGCNNVEQE
eukprot:785272-Amorphochlora_amoeboformis.AAC.1